MERIGERQALARTGAAERDSRREPLEIGDARQMLRHHFGDRARPCQLIDGIVPLENPLRRFQRSHDPAPQRARPHRRARGVDDAPERRARARRVARFDDLEIRQRGRIELQVVGVVVDAQRLHMFERPLVTRRRVSQRAAGSAGARVAVVESEAAQRLRAEMFRQIVVRSAGVEHRRLDRRRRDAELRDMSRESVRVGRKNRFARREAHHVVGEPRIVDVAI